MCSGAPEHPSLNGIIYCLSISGVPDNRLIKEFGIFTESLRLNNLQLIAQQNHCQLLNSPETDPVQYISNHTGIETLSKRYQGDVSYPETQLAKSNNTQRIPPSISLHRNKV
jgi:hypothetical protein